MESLEMAEKKKTTATTTKGYRCPACQSVEVKVASTLARPGRITRHRKCLTCGHTWKTTEQ